MGSHSEVREYPSLVVLFYPWRTHHLFQVHTRQENKTHQQGNQTTSMSTYFQCSRGSHPRQPGYVPATCQGVPVLQGTDAVIPSNQGRGWGWTGGKEGDRGDQKKPPPISREGVEERTVVRGKGEEGGRTGGRRQGKSPISSKGRVTISYHEPPPPNSKYYHPHRLNREIFQLSVS